MADGRKQGEEAALSRALTANRGVAVAGLTALASISAVATIILLAAERANANLPLPKADPVNPRATAEARALLQRLCAISGRYILSGQQNFPEDLAQCSDRVNELTGRYPAIFGQDFAHAGFDGRRARMVAETIRQHREGAIVALTWHAPSPAKPQSASYQESVQSKLTDEQWSALLTPGAGLYNRWSAQVDEIAAYLQQLNASGVPVLFRPYHEMNGRWFWWGGRPGPRGSMALYQQLYERYVQVHRLNNLVWVWNVNAPSLYAGPIERYYPGSAWVDVVTMDNYRRFRRRYYDAMLTLAESKPIALAEVGALPSINVLAKQPRWAWFMIWRGFEVTKNSPQQLRAMFHAPNVLSRGEPSLVTHPSENP
jgi:mannan endo-1,4-beta-mannosidase